MVSLWYNVFKLIKFKIQFTRDLNIWLNERNSVCSTRFMVIINYTYLNDYLTFGTSEDIKYTGFSTLYCRLENNKNNKINCVII